MLEPLLLPSGAMLQMCAVELAPDRVTVDIQTTAANARCPSCLADARRVHSHYQRRLADLSFAHTPVRLRLSVRRFFCDNRACQRTTFSEPIPALAPRYARRTARLLAEQRRLALDLGGEPGARLACRQGMAVSPDTLLRLARHTPTGPLATPCHLGVDDFALRKGQVYGTILVDLDQHQPIDLLPERSAELLEQWLKDHPGVEVITRDRATEYVEGASRGAPDAIQVADRFHLLQNVREMLQRLLERHQEALQAATRPPAPAPDNLSTPPAEAPSVPVPAPMTEAPGAPAPAVLAPPRTQAEQRSLERRNRRLARYTAVRELRAQGMSIRAIATHLRLSRKTVRHYSVAEQFPERATRRPTHSKLDRFIPYLEQQLAAGQDNAMQLWRDLRDQSGYTGSRALVSRWVARHRHVVPPADPASARPPQRGRRPAPNPTPPPPPQRRVSARQAAWLLVRDPAQLEADDRQVVERLCAHSPSIHTAHQLAQAFIQMVRERQADAFDGWRTRATASAIPELENFCVGLERDKAAVVAALALSFSNGQVEGQVNRLKLIKRSMYGRANFDLLRQRVLAQAA